MVNNSSLRILSSQPSRFRAISNKHIESGCYKSGLKRNAPMQCMGFQHGANIHRHAVTDAAYIKKPPDRSGGFL